MFTAASFDHSAALRGSRPGPSEHELEAWMDRHDNESVSGQVVKSQTEPPIVLYLIVDELIVSNPFITHNEFYINILRSSKITL